MWPPIGSPLKSKLISMYLPKRLELSLRLVLALPKASRTQLDLSSMFFTLQDSKVSFVILLTSVNRTNWNICWRHTDIVSVYISACIIKRVKGQCVLTCWANWFYLKYRWICIVIYCYLKKRLIMGGMVAQWLALSPHSKEVVGSIPRPGAFVCGDCKFFLCLFSPGTPAASHIPKKWTLLAAQTCLQVWVWVPVVVCLYDKLLILHMFNVPLRNTIDGSTPTLYLTVDFDFNRSCNKTIKWNDNKWESTVVAST